VNRSLELTPELLRLYSRRGNFHSDPEAAAALGYRHLVAQGMQVAGPAYGLLLDRWGDEFLAHGTIELKFVGPVVDGKTVDAEVDADDADDEQATMTVENRTRRRIAVVGNARRGAVAERR
jgi:acyl dehydratase